MRLGARSGKSVEVVLDDVRGDRAGQGRPRMVRNGHFRGAENVVADLRQLHAEWDPAQ